MTLLSLVPVAVLFPLGLFFLRISNWSSKESDYWYRIAAAVQVDPSLDDVYRPVLLWVQANRPNALQKALPWRPPVDRFREANS